MKLAVAFIIQIQLCNFISADNFDLNLNGFQVVAKRIKRAQSPTSRFKCIQPPITSDKIYHIKLSHNEAAAEAKPGQEVPENAIIISKCYKSYIVDYEYDESFELPSICTRNSWQPSILKCKRICENFSKFSNFDMTCYQYSGGPIIPCTGLLLEGAIVKLKCQQKFHPNSNVDYDNATCKDGFWDKEFFKCIPDCGTAFSNSIPLIADGKREKRGGAPWNLAIYNAEKTNEIPTFICGGTLINAELAVSAAHCFYNELFQHKIDSRFFYAIVGKATPDYEKEDYPTTKTYKLKNIYYPDITFYGALTNYVADIVILQLSEKVTFSLDVFPACLHLDDRDRFNPGENVTGKLSGFGAIKDESFPSMLLTANLPYISHSECQKRVAEDFRYSIPTDKFCAGSQKGSGARSGDSGGGLLFKDNTTGLYHLRGVVSVRDTSLDSSIATFTDIAQYMSWISKTMKNTESKSKICECNPNGTISFCDSKTCQPVALVTGKHCEDGSWKSLESSGNGCVDCRCNSNGSYSSVCDKTNGSCQCKPNVIGRQCDKCAFNTVWGSNGCEEGLNWIKFSHGDSCSNAVVVHNETFMNETSIIARHQINESLITRDSSLAEKLVVIPWFQTKSHFSEYEVLCGGYVEWVPTYFGNIPRGAVVSRIAVPINSLYNKGYAQKDNVSTNPAPFYICRALPDNGYMIPGETQPEGTCSISDKGRSIASMGIYVFDVLVQYNATACECDSIGSYGPICEGIIKSCKCKPNVIGKNCDRCAPDTYHFGPQGCKEGPKWLKYSNGEICSNAVVGGKEKSSNKSWFLTRYRKKNYHEFAPATLTFSSSVGAEVLQLSDPFLERQPHTYEVLCGGSTKWVRKTLGFSRETFIGYKGYGLDGVQFIYICRAVIEDSTYLGVMYEWRFCLTILIKGIGGSYTDFELLQVV